MCTAWLFKCHTGGALREKPSVGVERKEEYDLVMEVLQSRWARPIFFLFSTNHFRVLFEYSSGWFVRPEPTQGQNVDSLVLTCCSRQEAHSYSSDLGRLEREEWREKVFFFFFSQTHTALKCGWAFRAALCLKSYHCPTKVNLTVGNTRTCSTKSLLGTLFFCFIHVT